MDELYHVVETLGLECPWTKSLSCASMIQWLRSELVELEEEMARLDVITPATQALGNKANGNANVATSPPHDDSQKLLKNQDQHNKEMLVSELGDVLFDTLMLEMMVRR
jgi:NTP pyrophosphatase (non-canonical NTP hydrolase)